jgi:serine/threonine protein kinase
MMSSILRDTPPSVTDRRADLPPHLARVIRRCLEKDPRERYQTSRDVYNELKELRAETLSSSASPQRSEPIAAVTAPPPKSAARKRRVWSVALAAVLVGLGLYAARHWGRRTGGGPHVIQSIAVLPLDNYSGDPSQDYFAEGMTDELTSQLANISQLRVI